MHTDYNEPNSFPSVESEEDLREPIVYSDNDSLGMSIDDDHDGEDPNDPEYKEGRFSDEEDDRFSGQFKLRRQSSSMIFDPNDIENVIEQQSNVTVESTINFVRTKVSSSTGTVYNHRIGGVVGSSESCEYYNLKTITKLDFTFGSSSGNNCYGNVNLYVGGIVGYGDNNKFELCKTVNDFSIGINGYVTDSYYTTRGSSVVRYGGIVGSDFGDKTEILSCYAITNNFTGCHYNGTYDTVSFCYGGIAGSFAENSSKAKILNCVAKTIKYSITGHNYSWVAAWYHTNSSFGGISINTPKTFGGCYSNNDVNKKTSKVEKDVEYEGGSTSFSLEQMNTPAFVDEINLYGRLELGIESWTLDENGKLALVVPDVATSIKPVVKSSDSDRLEIYDLNGRKRSVVQKGINILNSADGTVRKIYIK